MFPYVKLLLKQRIASWNPMRYFGLERSGNKSKFTVVGIMIGALVMAGYLVALEVLLFNAFVQLGEPETMLAMIVLFSSLIMIVTSFFYVLSELFFAKDILFVSALPIPSRQLLWAKMLRIWLGEAIIALILCLPTVVLYGIHSGAGALYYVAGALLSLFVPLVPIALITLLSFVLIRISALWKHREKMTIVVSILFMAAVIWFQMQWTSGMGNATVNGAVYQMLETQQTVLHTLTRAYPPAGWFMSALTAGGINALLAWVGFAAVGLAAGALVAMLLGGKYQQLAIHQSETLVRVNAVSKRGNGKQLARTPLRALYRREVREIVSSPSYALNCLATGIMFPILLGMAFLGKQSNISGLNELLPMLNTLPTSIVTAAFTALFALAGSMNMAIGTSVSREGVRHEFFRTLPVAPQKLLLSKLLMGLTIGVIGSLPSAILLSVLFPALIPYTVVGWAASLLLMTCTALIGLMLDISHPKFGWKSETEAIKQNGMATLAMFGGMGLIAACGFAFYWLVQQGLSAALIYGLLLALAAVADLLLFNRLNNKSALVYIRKEVNL